MTEPRAKEVVDDRDVLVSRVLTPKERAMWLFKEFAPEVGALNVPLAVRLPGSLESDALQRAVDAVVRRHPALRTIFPLISGEPHHVTLDASSPRAQATVEVESLQDEELESALIRIGSAPFEVSMRPPLRVRVLSTDSIDVLYVVVDHLVYDAHSAGVLWRELLEIYDALRTTGRVPTRFSSEVVAPPTGDAGGAEHWQAVLEGARPTPDLWIGRQQARDLTFPGSAARHRLADGAWEAVGEVARRTGSVPSAVLLAAFSVVLARHGAGEDLVIGAPTLNRGPRGHDAIGYFTSVQPLRIRPAADLPFDHLVRQCAQGLLEGIQHAGVSLDDVAPDAYQATGDGKRPLVRYLFNYMVGLPLSQEGSSDGGRLHAPTLHSRMDLDLAVQQNAEGVSLRVLYASDLFSEVEAIALLARVEAVLQHIRHHQVTVGEVDPWSLADRSLAASALPDAIPHDEVKTGVLDELNTMAFATPDAPALSSLGATGPALTYESLLTWSMTLADALVAAGASPGGTIAVVTEDPAETAVACVACWAVQCAVLLPGASHGTANIATLTVVGSDASKRAGKDQISVGSLPRTGPVASPIAPHPDDLAVVWDGPEGLVKMSHHALWEASTRLADALQMQAGGGLATTIAPREPAGLILATTAWVGGGAVQVASPSEHGLLVRAVGERHCEIAVLGAQEAPPIVAEFVRADAGPAPRRLAVVGGPIDTESVREAAAAHVDLMSVLGLDEVGTPVAVSGAPVLAVTIHDGSGRPVPPGVYGTLRVPLATGGDEASLLGRYRLTFTGTLERWADPHSTATVIEAPTEADGHADPEPGSSQHAMLELWRQLLRRPDLKPGENFFSAGGDSMLAARVVGHVKRKLGVRVPLRILFNHPTAEAFATEVERARLAALDRK